MKGLLNSPLFYRFWDMPPKPEILLRDFPPVVDSHYRAVQEGRISPNQQRQGREENRGNAKHPVILDFGPAFPWNTEARLTRTPNYSEDLMEALAKRLSHIQTLWWYIPLQPHIWRGDLPCYDYMNQDLGLASEVRFLQEQLADLENLGFTNLRLALDPGEFRSLPEHRIAWQRIQESRLPVNLVPPQVSPISAAAILFPQVVQRLSELEKKTEQVTAMGCSALSLLGPLFQGVTRGYSEAHKLNSALDDFHSARETVNTLWEQWACEASKWIMEDAVSQILDARLYSLRALAELLENRNREYQRFRKLFPLF